MTRRQRRWRRLVVLLVSVLMGAFGCATLLQSKEQRVVLSSDPPKAVVVINGEGEVIRPGRTPVEVVLKPTGDYVVSFEKEGCVPFSQALAHEGGWGQLGTVQYPITQLKSAHVRLDCGQ